MAMSWSSTPRRVEGGKCPGSTWPSSHTWHGGMMMLKHLLTFCTCCPALDLSTLPSLPILMPLSSPEGQQALGPLTHWLPALSMLELTKPGCGLCHFSFFHSLFTVNSSNITYFHSNVRASQRKVGKNWELKLEPWNKFENVVVQAWEVICFEEVSWQGDVSSQWQCTFLLQD